MSLCLYELSEGDGDKERAVCEGLVVSRGEEGEMKNEKLVCFWLGFSVGFLSDDLFVEKKMERR